MASSAATQGREEHGELTPVFLYFGLEPTQFISTYRPLATHHYTYHLIARELGDRLTLPMCPAGGTGEKLEKYN